jgi:hypothetical protein
MLDRFTGYLVKSGTQSTMQGLKTLLLMTKNSKQQINRALEAENEAS